jgi:hypothetical protein
MADDLQRTRSGIVLLRLSISAFAVLLATPAKPVDLDELTVVTLSRDGAWGVATGHALPSEGRRSERLRRSIRDNTWRLGARQPLWQPQDYRVS